MVEKQKRIKKDRRSWLMPFIFSPTRTLIPILEYYPNYPPSDEKESGYPFYDFHVKRKLNVIHIILSLSPLLVFDNIFQYRKFTALLTFYFGFHQISDIFIGLVRCHIIPHVKRTTVTRIKTVVF